MRTCRFRSILRALCCAAALLTLTEVLHADSISLEMRRVRGARVYVVTADLNDPRVYVDITIPERGLYHSESFARLVQHDKPVAAVTGTYFDTRTLLPVGSLISQGRKLFEGGIGSAVCFLRPEGVRCVAASPEAGLPAPPPAPLTVRFLDKRKGEACDWTGVDCGLRAGPRLLANGAFVLNPRREGFHHPGLFGRRARMAMGLTPANKLLLVAVRTPVTFGHTASIMKSLGAVEAICLDGGSSSAMFYRGKFIARPGRALTNIIEVHLREAPEAPSIPGPVAYADGQVWREAGEQANADVSGSGVRQAWQAIESRDPETPSNSEAVGFVREEQAAPAPTTELRLTKGRRALFPVHRA